MVKVYVQQKNIYKIFDSSVVAQKLRFKFNFFSEFHNIKHNFYSYQIPYYVFFIVNTKTSAKQTHR